MKEWFRNNWVKVMASILILWLMVFFVFRERIMNTRFAKGKMEILQGIQEQDKAKIKNGLDSMKLKRSK